MVYAKNPAGAQSDPDVSNLPDGTEHVIYARRNNPMSSHPPRGYGGETDKFGTVQYEYADELPEDCAERSFGTFSDVFVAVDEDGKVLHSPDEMDSHEEEAVVREWKANGFKPDDYSTRYYREQGGGE